MRRIRRRFEAPERADTSGIHHVPDAVQLGSNQLGVREFNERLILRLVRRAGSVSKAEIARTTNLSAQTVTVIVNSLLRLGLLRKEQRRREAGKVGQPAVPIAINPKGAYSIGVKIGRRSVDVLMIDFLGEVQRRHTHRHAFPHPDDVFEKVERDISEILTSIGDKERQRIVGIGAVAPFYLESWESEIDAPEDVMSLWGDIDIRQRIAASQTLPVWFSNDATAACIADLAIGAGALFTNYLYFFVGTFIGGGVILNGTLFGGHFGNAGAVGSMPLPASYSQVPEDVNESVVQLIHCASRYIVEDQLDDAGFDPMMSLPLSGADVPAGLPPEVEKILNTWVDKTGDALGLAALAAISVVDFEGIVIDGALPESISRRLAATVERVLEAAEMRGLERPQICAGSIGNEGRALGGAMLPFYWNFAPDREVLLKLRSVATI